MAYRDGITYEYVRAGTCNLFVAVEPKGGRRTVVVTDHRAVGPFRLASARIKLGHRGFIGMQHTPFAQPHRQAIGQRLQGGADFPHPFGQGGTGQNDPLHFFVLGADPKQL